MTTKKIYGPRIKWDGGECPVPLDTRVEVKLRNGDVLEPAFAFSYEWRHDGDGGDIVEYRIVTEQADLDVAEKLLRENGYTVTKPLTFEDVVPMTEAPPKGTEYWVVPVSEPEGVFCASFYNDEYDSLYMKRRMAYLDKEHALIAARHIFGLKGGEL